MSTIMHKIYTLVANQIISKPKTSLAIISQAMFISYISASIAQNSVLLDIAGSFSYSSNTELALSG